MVIVHGVDKRKFDKFRIYNISEKELADFRSMKDGAIAGQRIASRKGWKVGQQVDVRKQLDLQFTIAGIFYTGNEEQDNTVFTGFEYAQDSRDSRGWTNLIYIRLREGAKAEKTAAAIDAMPLSIKTNTQAEKSFVSSMLEDLGDMIRISRLVILITLVVVFAGIANTISMSVRDRTQQIGVMRTLGFRRNSVLSLVMAESAMISVIGGILAAIAAFGVFHLTEVAVQSRTYNFTVSLSPATVVAGLGIAVLVGIAGGFLPARRASRLNIVESLRSVD